MDLFYGIHLPTSLLTVDRPFGVVLTVLEMRLQLVQPQCCCAAKARIITADLKFGQHVAHNAGHRTEVSQRHYCAVNRTNLLLGKPLRYAGIAESMFTVWSLRWKNAYAYKTNVMSEIQIELKGGGYFDQRLACTGSSNTPLHIGHNRSSSTSP